jgi:hypothetical protein
MDYALCNMNVIMSKRIRNVFKRYLIRYICVSLIVRFAGAFLLAILLRLHLVQKPISFVDADFAEMNCLKFFMLVVIIGPIVEECVFRLPLRIRKNNLIIAIIVLMLAYLRHLIVKGSLLSFIILFICGVFIVSCLFLHNCQFRKFQMQYGKWLYWISIAIFTLVHLSNYEIVNMQTFLGAFIYVAGGIFVLAYYVTIVRLKCGIAYSITLHSLNNLVGFIFYLIFS